MIDNNFTKKLMQKIHILPIMMAFAAVTLGVHIGHVTQALTVGNAAIAEPLTLKEKNAAKVKQPVSRSEIALSSEIAQHTNSSNALDSGDKARQVELRERLAEATEKRIDGKLAELKSQQVQVGQQAQLRKQQTDQQFASLVKLYEAMKPKDAARIFEKLDMSVQLAVSTRMREQKMAAIMAEMSSDSARSLTMQMASLARSNSVAH